MFNIFLNYNRFLKFNKKKRIFNTSLQGLVPPECLKPTIERLILPFRLVSNYPLQEPNNANRNNSMSPQSLHKLNTNTNTNGSLSLSSSSLSTTSENSSLKEEERNGTNVK